jgi:hypothetical protein
MQPYMISDNVYYMKNSTWKWLIKIETCRAKRVFLFSGGDGKILKVLMHYWSKEHVHVQK